MRKATIGLTFAMIMFVLVLIGYFDSNGWSLDNKAYKNISADQFVKMMGQKDFTLINVHIPYQGEIAGTDLLIPFNQIDRYENQLPADKDAKLVVYCMMGPMGRIAAEELVRRGYRQVSNLQGGMMAWQMAGKELQFRSD